ncbi:TPR Domain containing protein [Trichomonas vaginalis G3]|uniref:TPR Domain containing protein n=1 Tax=Trichomonas vaginalis (strain ATCC PRA-98 / G3) TaxID=412133 RepID=A2DF21_TRIV3|nr:protein ubiquitination [Trichomonas vaginalis G3]EAY21013.1 TPR Domain containing protein [Trichomonas vaginalis G3]KAI5519190.1 protein ubiquitination [Trichomonas vaginalis G3]|eukprot:XP_001581999.1 TPR Domain containing protein [Trichomonas vaginalis G3]
MSTHELNQMISLGLYKSVNMAVQMTASPSPQLLISRAFALIDMKLYEDALHAVESVDMFGLSQELANDLIEIRLTAHLKMNNPQKCCTIIQSRDFSNRLLTPKLDLLVAQVHMLNNPLPNPDHPAIPHLLRVLQRYPLAFELIEKLIGIGAKIPEFILNSPNSCVKNYAHALQLAESGDYKDAVRCLNQILVTIPGCIPVLVKICQFAIADNNTQLFEDTIVLIPENNLEVIELRAVNLKQQQKKTQLNQVVLRALNTDPTSANAWIAFSHLLEANGDQQRALQATRKALILEPNSRSGFMRHGELRLQRNDVVKAHSAFTHVHTLNPAIDSFSAIVQCDCLLKNWEEAESFAAGAVKRFKPDTYAGNMAITLYGLAKRGTDPKKAAEILRRCLEKDSGNIEALSALIEMHVKDNEFDQAESLLMKHRNSKNIFFFNYKMAEIYSVKRDYQTAMDYAQQALQIEPNNERAKDLLEQLEGVLRDNDDTFEEDEVDL